MLMLPTVHAEGVHLLRRLSAECRHSGLGPGWSRRQEPPPLMLCASWSTIHQQWRSWAMPRCPHAGRACRAQVMRPIERGVPALGFQAPAQACRAAACAGEWARAHSALQPAMPAPDTGAHRLLPSPATRARPANPSPNSQEAQRLYSVAPLVVRKALRDVRVGRFCVPAGTCLLLHIFAMHTTSANWERPDEFLPARCPPPPPFPRRTSCDRPSCRPGAGAAARRLPTASGGGCEPCSHACSCLMRH